MSFLDDKQMGTEGESAVVRFLEGKGYVVEIIGQELGKWRNKDYAGIYTAPDIKVSSHKAGGDKWLVGKTLEVKSDARSSETGNYCIEIFSNVGSGRLGWAYTTDADFIGFLSAGDGTLCIVPVSEIRGKLAESWHRFKAFGIPDGFISSMIIPVPIPEMKRISKWHGNIW